METTFRMIRTPEWKYVEFPKFPPILFNMIEDPDENHNLASEPKYKKITKELHALMWEDCQSWESLFAKGKLILSAPQAKAVRSTTAVQISIRFQMVRLFKLKKCFTNNTCLEGAVYEPRMETNKS